MFLNILLYHAQISLLLLVPSYRVISTPELASKHDIRIISIDVLITGNLSKSKS